MAIASSPLSARARRYGVGRAGRLTQALVGLAGAPMGIGQLCVELERCLECGKRGGEVPALEQNAAAEENRPGIARLGLLEVARDTDRLVESAHARIGGPQLEAGRRGGADRR